MMPVLLQSKILFSGALANAVALNECLLAYEYRFKARGQVRLLTAPESATHFSSSGGLIFL